MTRLLEVNELTVSFSGIRAVSAASFSVDAGEIVAIIGPNGAGKSTVLNALSGVVRPDAGSIRLDGAEILGLPPHRIARMGVRRTFQNGGLFGEMTALENVLVGFHQGFRRNVFGLILPNGNAAAEEKDARDHAESMLAEMGLQKEATRLVKELSGGQQRIVEVLRTIAGAPRFILLDEPSVGLSPTARVKLVDTVRRMASQNDAGVILIEHAIDLVMELCSRIVVLNAGQKIADGAPADVRNDPNVLEAYLGTSSSI